MVENAWHLVPVRPWELAGLSAVGPKVSPGYSFNYPVPVITPTLQVLPLKDP